MQKLSLSMLFLALPAMAAGQTQTLDFAVTTPDRDLGIYLVAGQTDCPATRFLIVGAGFQAISAPLLPGETVVLPLGHGLVVGDHQVQVQAMDCAFATAAVHLVTLGRSSPGHGRALLLQASTAVEAVEN